VIDSMATACKEAGVQIVAGDTKVVEKGKADGLYINTAGFGQIKAGHPIGGQYAQPGDAVLISGPMGDHGIAVLQARGDLGFDSNIQSDVAPLNKMIANLISGCPQIHVLRDPTRGGLATTLNEIACQSEVGLLLDEDTIPVRPDVRTACEMLGFDPLYIANEGKLILILPKTKAKKALHIMQNHAYGREAAQIGIIQSENPGRVLLKTSLGTTRILDTLSGEILPRIC
jgi:hydrogenase expression/formation protein HypE